MVPGDALKYFESYAGNTGYVLRILEVLDWVIVLFCQYLTGDILGIFRSLLWYVEYLLFTPQVRLY